MENVMFSAMAIIMFIVIFWQIGEIRHCQAKIADMIEDIGDSLEMLGELSGASSQKEDDALKMLAAICETINALCHVEQDFMNNTSTALYNLVVCMVPIVDGIKSRAIKDENYEKAQECANLLHNLTQIINTKKQ